ncbi:MAG: glycoside hydrolase family 99-like domain-containing protein [bacterium]
MGSSKIIAVLFAMFFVINSLGEESLVGYWSFDEGRGFLARDSSGNEINALIKGAKWIRGLWGSALEFGGDGGVFINSDLLDGMSELTVALWLYIEDDRLSSPLAKKECVYRFIFSPEGDHFVVATTQNPWYSAGTVVPIRKAPRRKWFFLAGTYSQGTLKVFIDGELVGRRSGLAGNVVKSGGPLTLGLADAPNIDNFRGKIDELRIYRRALSEEEIRNLYNSYWEKKYFSALPRRGGYSMGKFLFSHGLCDWEGIDVGEIKLEKDELKIEVKGQESAIANNSLSVPLEDRDFVVLNMGTSKGGEGRIFFKTTGGSRMLSFPLKSDGKMHTYCLRVSGYKEWKGELLALSLFPSDEECSARIRSIELRDAQSAPPQVEIEYFFSDLGVNRAQRPVKILTFLKNKGGKGRIKAELTTCKGVKVFGENVRFLEIEPGERKKIVWEVEAEKALEGELKLSVSAPNMEEEKATYRISFTPPLKISKASYIPEPKPAKADVLIGAWNCPLWENTDLWKTVLRDLWRVPVLGFYDELNPEVKDWEIKWAVEHGIQFFVFCWYRRNQGKAPIETIYERPITEALYRAKFLPFIKFTIMWENQARGVAGVSDENDLLSNLLPYWIERFFKHPSYLKIDNKPVLFIYRPEFLVDDLKGVANVKRALEKMREKCKEAGFSGLIIIGEYRGLDPNHLKLMHDMGLDYTSAYVWPVPGNPKPEEAIQKQVEYWTKTRDMKIIPEIITLSMGWTGWQDEGSIWKLPPKDFKKLCLKAKEFLKSLPPSQLGSRMILLDNWNEWGEGHYIMPHREYGFGYLDAVREVFCDAPKNHIDLIPEDIGLGPYEHREFIGIDK